MPYELREGYLALLKKYPSDERKIVVTRTAHSVLAPSEELLWDIKDKKITWEEYEKRFREEMKSSSEAQYMMGEIIGLLYTTNVRLICYEKKYPCHRFILIDMIKEMKERLYNDYKNPT